MNKAITDGLLLTPPPFEDGLTVWSSQDGTPGSDTYASAANAAFVPADQDFSGCLELQKAQTLTKVRYMGQTPILPGCYLRVKARVKAISGNLPTVQIGAYPAQSNGAQVAGLTVAGPATPLTSYGQVVEVSAIVGTGARSGVDMAWNDSVSYAHIGVDLTGPNGGIVRVDDIEIEDITGAFLRDMLDWVDVRDYGAIGDGATDDTAAFNAADAAANGRTVLVSKGVYRLTDHVTINSPVRFEGSVTIPSDKRLSLIQNFDLNSYADAFDDEVEGFKKAFQALLNFSDHEALDMNGRRLELTEPLDMHTIVGNKDSYANRRVVRNGQFNCVASSGWDTEVHTASCTFDSDNPKELTNVVNVAAIPIGSLVEAATGVGREIYVRGKDVAGQKLYLSQDLYGAPGFQSYTFKRFKYALDFSGFANLQRFVLSDIEILMAGRASGILLPYNALIFHVKDSFFTGPKDRGLTSYYNGCQGMLLDRCQWLSAEQGAPVQDRVTIGFNTNKNDCKIRDNRAVKFKTWAIMHGTGHLISNNHFFQGDGVTNGQRSAGLVLTAANVKSSLVGNYVDNCYLEWTNEHDGHPDFASELSFGGLSLIGNIFMSSNVAAWYRPIHVKPYGEGHFINGLNINGNIFKQIKGPALDRVDLVDTSIADLDRSRYVDVNVKGNTFHGVAKQFQNPITAPVTYNTASTQWDLSFADFLPFGGEARVVQSIMPEGNIRSASNQVLSDFPFAAGKQGADKQSARVTWPTAAKGKIFITARCDAPT